VNGIGALKHCYYLNMMGTVGHRMTAVLEGEVAPSSSLLLSILELSDTQV